MKLTISSEATAEGKPRFGNGKKGTISVFIVSLLSTLYIKIVLK